MLQKCEGSTFLHNTLRSSLRGCIATRIATHLLYLQHSWLRSWENALYKSSNYTRLWRNIKRQINNSIHGCVFYVFLLLYKERRVRPVEWNLKKYIGVTNFPKYVTAHLLSLSVYLTTPTWRILYAMPLITAASLTPTWRILCAIPLITVASLTFIWDEHCFQTYLPFMWDNPRRIIMRMYDCFFLLPKTQHLCQKF